MNCPSIVKCVPSVVEALRSSLDEIVSINEKLIGENVRLAATVGNQCDQIFALEQERDDAHTSIRNMLEEIESLRAQVSDRDELIKELQGIAERAHVAPEPDR